MTISESAEKIEKLRNKIIIELLPKDVNDDKNIIIKIRKVLILIKLIFLLVTCLDLFTLYW